LPKKAAGRLTPVKDFLSKMTENMQARCVPSRQARFNQGFPYNYPKGGALK